jgi:hypothetical protein
VNVSTLRTLLLLVNILLVLCLAGLVGLIVVDIREFQSAENQVKLGAPPTYREESKTGHTEAYFSAIHRLEVGLPAPEMTEPSDEPNWIEGFLAKWTVKTRPMVRRDPTKSRAVMEDVTTTAQKICEVAPEGTTITELSEHAASLGLPAAELPTLLDDPQGTVAMVAEITSDGVGLVNEKGEEGLIPYEEPDLDAALQEQMSGGGGATGGGGGTNPADMPDRTRPIGKDIWEVGRDDQLDLQKNYARYLEEVTLRPHYDRRTRRLEGVQIRSSVPNPKFQRFGLKDKDIIVRINGRPVTSASEVTSIVEANRGAGRVVVELIRSGQSTTMTYSLRKGAVPPGKGR